jgi:hypothetical protein
VASIALRERLHGVVANNVMRRETSWSVSKVFVFRLIRATFLG